MRINEPDLNKRPNLPSLIKPRLQPYFTDQTKSGAVNSKIKPDMKAYFLTRYNKKFWEPPKDERGLSQQYFFKKEAKTHQRFDSQHLKRPKQLDIVEVNDFDDRMKSDLENIDRWVFNCLKKMTLPVNEGKGKTGDEKLPINMDLKMLNFIIQTSRQAIDAPNPNTLLMKNGQDGIGERDIQSKIAITSETLNNEYNKSILMDLIKRKILSHEEYQKRDSSYNMMLAKMIATDLIASFKTLNVFRHQNVLRLKEVLESVSRDMESARVSILNTKNIDTVEDYLFYEKTLKKNLKECEEDIRIRKEASKRFLDAIRHKKTTINSEKQRLFDFSKMLEEKENETGRNRKVGEKMKLREFMEINEYKSKKIKLEGSTNQYTKSALRDIDEMNIKIEKLEKEIDDFKFKKAWFIFKLKEYFLDFLVNEEELIKVDKSLIAMIKSMWNLNEEIFPSSFSRFYDKEDLAFALNYAKIHNEFIHARADKNSKKKEIKDALKKNFDQILKEDEYEIIASFKENLKKFKANELKLFEKKKIKSTRRSFIYKYVEVTPATSGMETDMIMGSRSKRKPDTDDFSIALSALSEKLTQLKEQHIEVVIKRTIDKNNRSKLLGLSNSEYMKKILRLLFGNQEMQIILQRLLKTNKIQIVPI